MVLEGFEAGGLSGQRLSKQPPKSKALAELLIHHFLENLEKPTTRCTALTDNSWTSRKTRPGGSERPAIGPPLGLG